MFREGGTWLTSTEVGKGVGLERLLEVLQKKIAVVTDHDNFRVCFELFASKADAG